MCGAIREFGFRIPILVRSDGSVIDGHLRLKAAHQLGLEQIPVVVADDLTPAQVKAFRLLVNRSATWAEWDEDLLRLELEELQALDYDLDLTGFGSEELHTLLGAALGEGDGAAGSGDEDAVPEPPVDPVSRTGDLWLLGKHRLLCGDATVLTDVERVLDGGQAAMCFTDSPYNVDYGAPGKGGKNRRILNDALGDGFGRFLTDACVNILTVTSGAVYMCMSSSELHTLQRAFLEAGGHWSTFIIWAKNCFTLGRSDYQRQFEPILYGWKEGNRHHWCGARDQGDVWFIKKPAVNDLHPTMKPVELVERAVLNSSQEGDTVLDPFCGSGTTLIACEKQGRQARLLELDPKYCDVIIQRWQDATGVAAVLDGVGSTFEAVAAEREVRLVA
jgi:DNA modification methylase